MPDKTQIHIVSKFTCSFSHRQTGSERVQIDYGPQHRLWLEHPESTDSRDHKSVLCVYRVVNIKTKFVEELRSIARGEYKVQGVPFTVDLEKKTKQRLEFPSGLSPGAEDRLGQLTSEMTDVAERFVCKLRWRFGLGGRGRAFPTAPDEFWSEDAKNWITLPTKMFGYPEGHRNLLVGCLSEEIVTELKADDLTEPIAHSLFRDAWSKRHGDHEAALMQAIVALEVGVKNCVVRLLPDAKYLVLEMPSPPVVKLLRDFLPALAETTGAKAPNLPPKIVKAVTNMVHQRNLLVHKGELTVDGYKVAEYLEIVHDLLYFLDFVSGSEWALALTSREFKVWLREELPNANLTDPLTEHESKVEPSDAPESASQSVSTIEDQPRTG